MKTATSIRLLLLTAVVIGLVQSPVADAQDSPNVLFIAIDDLNDWVGVMNNNPQIKTPNIDRLAKRGMLFTDAHCQAPICDPSRASVMSGMLNASLGSYAGKRGDAPNLVPRVKELGSETLDEYFRSRGYKTFASGKVYHFAAEHVDVGGENKPRPRTDLPVPRDWERPNKWPGHGTGTNWGPHGGVDQHMNDYEIATRGREYLQQDHDQPFFMMIGFHKPHVAWIVPEKWFQMYPTDQVWLPPYKADDLEDLPPISAAVNINDKMPTTQWAKENGEWRNIVQAYAACVSFVDAQVGRVLDGLEESGHADDTIVVLWSDHGYHMGEKNTFQKHSLWERSTHVPLIFAGPGVPQGQTCDKVVSLIDMYPTLVELAGMPGNPKVDGRSLVPLLKDPEAKWNGVAICEWKWGSTAVITDEYRYMHYSGKSNRGLEPAEELYDRQADPYEWHNLADDPEYAEVTESLSLHLPD